MKTLQTGAVDQIFPAFTALYQLVFMLDKSCDIEEFIYDLTSWCTSGHCDGNSVLNNLLNNVFNITGAINSIAEKFYNTKPDYSNLAYYSTMSEDLGSSLGKIMKSIFAYKV